FGIDNIPVSSTSDYETAKYLIHYDGFDDSDTSNDYISLYTKDSSSWSASENYGKLKEGKREVRIRAYDNAGNNIDAAREFYVDFTAPGIDSLSAHETGVNEGYRVVTTTKPTIHGTFTDNLKLNKVNITYSKENY